MRIVNENNQKLLRGDIATINPQGYMQITYRIKGVIKTGGEWSFVN